MMKGEACRKKRIGTLLVVTMHFAFIDPSLRLIGRETSSLFFRHSVLLLPFMTVGHVIFQAHARSFRVSEIHRALTWTTGCLMSVRDHSYACVYTRIHTDSFYIDIWVSGHVRK